MRQYEEKYIGIKDKHGKIIKIGDTIRDGNGITGIVEENMHPWGWKRLQYKGLSIINHPDKNWYEII